MPKYLPVKAAREIGQAYDCRQVILIAWDGRLTHIVTWGKSVDDCSQAADGGNKLKEKWGWPESNDQPSRVRSIQTNFRAQMAQMERTIAELRATLCNEGIKDPTRL